MRERLTFASRPSAFGLVTIMAGLMLTACMAPQQLPDLPAEPVLPNQTENTPPQPIDPVPVGSVKIGLLLPLSGPASALGVDMLSAAQMAMFDLPPHDFVLLPRDTGGDANQARAAAQSVIDQGAEIILGPLLSSSTQAVREVVKAHAARGNAQIQQISPTIAPAETATVPQKQNEEATDNSVSALIERAFSAIDAKENEDQLAEIEPGAGDEIQTAQAAAGNRITATSSEPIKVISFSSNAKVAGDGVYILGFRPEEQVERVVTYAVRQGHPRIAFLGPDDAYGTVTLSGYRAGRVAAASSGSERYALYPPAATDQSDAVRRVSDFATRAAEVDQQRALLEQRDDAAAVQALKALENIDTQTPPPFDAVVIADGGNRLQSVGALLAFFDVTPPDVRMLGTMRWLDDLTALDEPNLDNSWIAAVDQEKRAAFDGLFERRLGKRPNLLAQLAYDSVALAVAIGQEDRRYPVELLTDAEGFAGSGGIFRIRPDGLTEHGLAILEVGRGGIKAQREPAPSSFNTSLAGR